MILLLLNSITPSVDSKSELNVSTKLDVQNLRQKMPYGLIATPLRLRLGGLVIKCMTPLLARR